MCIYEYITPEVLIGGPTQLRISGPAMTLTAILFDSEESAADHYQFSLDNIRLMRDAVSPDSDVTEGVLGLQSYQLTVDVERVGSMIGIRVGPYILQLHTTPPDGQSALVAPQDLLALAGTARDALGSPQ